MEFHDSTPPDQRHDDRSGLCGNKGTHNELAQGDQAQLPPELIKPQNGLLDLVPNPFFGLIDPASVLGSRQSNAGISARAYAAFSSVGTGIGCLG